MITWLLNLAYLLLLAVASPWLAYRALRHGKYRQGWSAKFWGAVPRRTSPRSCVWLHAVSVGEVQLLAPVLKQLDQRGDFDLVISTTTKTGYETASKRYAEQTVIYCPLDFSWAVNRALDRINPDLLVLAELELWPNLIRMARRRNVPVAVINGRLSDRSYRGYRRARRMLAPIFESLGFVGAQTREYADRFRALGVSDERLTVTGSLKFDGAEGDRRNDRSTALAAWAELSPTDVVFCAGSTQEPEEAYALQVFQNLGREFPQLRLLIVPRHPERFESVAELLRRSGLPWSRRSTDPTGRHRVILVDTVGELGAWWGTAHIAYVGGSMGRREGQNMIEPAAYGAAVSFGPRTRNFRDVVALFETEDATTVVRGAFELEQFVRRCLEDRAWADARGFRARQVVASQRGSTRKTVDALMRLLANGKVATVPDDSPATAVVRRAKVRERHVSLER